MCGHDDGKLGEDAVLDVKVSRLLGGSNDKHVRTPTMAVELFGKGLQGSRFGRMRRELWGDCARVRNQAGLQDRFRKILIRLGVHFGRIRHLRTISSRVDEVDAWFSALDEKTVQMPVVHHRVVKIDVPHALPLVKVAMSADRRASALQFVEH
jgi:hypothetical protein